MCFPAMDGVADLVNCAGKTGARDVLELACALHPAPQLGPVETNAVIRANGCLVAFGASTLLRLLTSGTTRLIVRLDACSECRIGKALPHIEQTVATVRELFAQSENANSVVALTAPANGWQVRSVYEAKNPPVSRREMFGVFSLESKRLASRAFANAESQTGETKRGPRERRRLISVLGSASSNRSMQLQAQGLALVRLIADDKCTACGTCARICPNGALQFTTPTRDSYRLAFVTAACMDCGVCASVCKPHALQRDGMPTLAELLAQEPITLRAGSLCACDKCGARFASVAETRLCPICALRKADPFVSRRTPA